MHNQVFRHQYSSYLFTEDVAHGRAPVQAVCTMWLIMPVECVGTHTRIQPGNKTTHKQKNTIFWIPWHNFYLPLSLTVEDFFFYFFCCISFLLSVTLDLYCLAFDLEGDCCECHVDLMLENGQALEYAWGVLCITSSTVGMWMKNFLLLKNMSSNCISVHGGFAIFYKLS